MQGFISFFREIELNSFKKIFRNLVKTHYGEKDIIHKENSKHWGLLFIDKGFVAVVDKYLQR